MIAGLSPLARRMVAVGLLVLVLLLAVAAVEMVGTGTADALASLEQARIRSARLEALRDRPSPPEAPPTPAGFYFQAASAEAAAALAIARVNAAAASAELSPQSLAVAPQDAANPNLIRLTFAIEGPETKLLSLIGDVESGMPAIRLRAWRINRLQGDASGLRLEATAVAAWGGRP